MCFHICENDSIIKNPGQKQYIASVGEDEEKREILCTLIEM